MATGHEDYAGYVQLWGAYDDEPKQVAFDEYGNPVIVWVD